MNNPTSSSTNSVTRFLSEGLDACTAACATLFCALILLATQAAITFGLSCVDLIFPHSRATVNPTDDKTTSPPSSSAPILECCGPLPSAESIVSPRSRPVHFMHGAFLSPHNPSPPPGSGIYA
jgi:hypothetical protein